MKAIVCEMCESNDVIKQDGVYVCQYCGTKYSVEEARKLMVEGVVKIDTSEETANLYTIARRARRENDGVTALKCYNMLLAKDPTNWEPTFYSVYYTYTTMTNDEIGDRAVQITNCLRSVLSMINELSDIEAKSALLELQQNIKDLVAILCIASTNYYKSLPSIAKTAYDRAIRTVHIATLAFTMGDGLRNHNMVDSAAELYKIAISTLSSEPEFTLNMEAVPSMPLPFKYHEMVTRMTEASDYIRKIEPNYQSQREIRLQNAANKKSGCYVATAVYGSYDCPQVWTLRRFRDNTLAEIWYGRAFIRAYYAISPTLVKWFGKTEWFKNLWKPTLDRMVERLNGNGVEDTPYDDRSW